MVQRMNIMELAEADLRLRVPCQRDAGVRTLVTDDFVCQTNNCSSKPRSPLEINVCPRAIKTTKSKP